MALDETEAQVQTKRLSVGAPHIRDMLTDLYAALEDNRGWSLLRLGDGELRILRGDHAPFGHIENVVAAQPDMLVLHGATVEALKQADWVGWHQDAFLTQCMEDSGALPKGWTAMWREEYEKDCIHGFLIDPLSEGGYFHRAATRWGEVPALYQRSQYAWCNLHMGLRRGFVERVLRAQKLFLVGEPMQRWLDEVLRPAGLGAAAEVYAGKQSPTTAEDLRKINAAVAESSARVVLASLGVWALPVAGAAKQAGKIGLDWGHAPDHHRKPVCAVHRDSFDPPYPMGDSCPHDSGCQAHWRYKLNTTEEDSPEGTMRWYAKAGTANQCLPE